MASPIFVRATLTRVIQPAHQSLTPLCARQEQRKGKLLGIGGAKRTWRRIALELVTETNPEQYRQLTEELVKAVEAYNRSLPHHPRTHGRHTTPKRKSPKSELGGFVQGTSKFTLNKSGRGLSAERQLR